MFFGGADLTTALGAARVLLAGATGYIGRAVLAALAERGYAVIVVVRETPNRNLDALRAGLPPSCELRVADLTDAESSGAALAGLRVHATISCLASRSGVSDDAWRVDHGANRNLLAAAMQAGATQFVLLSAICVQKPRLAFQHAKLAFESELMASGLDYTIVRPTAFFKSLAGQVARVQAGKPFLVFGDGNLTACKPIGEGDLARFIVDRLADPATRNCILPVGGPGPALTPREQGALLCRLAGRPTRFRRVPTGIFTAASLLLVPLARVFPRFAAKAELARIGRYYATESMLLWNEDTACYDDAATPEFGCETLEDFYRRVLAEGMKGQTLGEQGLF